MTVTVTRYANGGVIPGSPKDDSVPAFMLNGGCTASSLHRCHHHGCMRLTQYRYCISHR